MAAVLLRPITTRSSLSVSTWPGWSLRSSVGGTVGAGEAGTVAPPGPGGWRRAAGAGGDAGGGSGGGGGWGGRERLLDPRLGRAGLADQAHRRDALVAAGIGHRVDAHVARHG